jgi:hypothetical protein
VTQSRGDGLLKGGPCQGSIAGWNLAGAVVPVATPACGARLEPFSGKWIRFVVKTRGARTKSADPTSVETALAAVRGNHDVVEKLAYVP